MGAFRIYPDITRAALRRLLPRGSVRAPHSARGAMGGDGERVVAIVFRLDTRRVVRARQAQKALAQLPSGDAPTVAVAGSFSIEAVAQLRARGVELHSTRDYVWTEAAIDEVRRPPKRMDRHNPAKNGSALRPDAEEE